MGEKSWAAEEFEEAGLGEARLTKRLVELAGVLGEKPSASLPEACGNAARLTGADRFFDHAEVTPAGRIPAGRLDLEHVRPLIRHQLAGQRAQFARGQVDHPRSRQRPAISSAMIPPFPRRIADPHTIARTSGWFKADGIARAIFPGLWLSNGKCGCSISASA